MNHLCLLHNICTIFELSSINLRRAISKEYFWSAEGHRFSIGHMLIRVFVVRQLGPDSDPNTGSEQPWRLGNLMKDWLTRISIPNKTVLTHQYNVIRGRICHLFVIHIDFRLCRKLASCRQIRQGRLVGHHGTFHLITRPGPWTSFAGVYRCYPLTVLRHQLSRK